MLFEREGTGLGYPALVITADSASYDDRRPPLAAPERRQPRDRRPGPAGHVRVPDDAARALTQTPADLLAEPKAPDEMRYGELGRYIEALSRSGNDANKLIVERALKLAIPVTCFIIALFGAPLAVTSPRAGAAVGIAISLGTTVIFLLVTQITKAVGAGGVVDPVLAAWLPNAVFFLAASAGCSLRVRTIDAAVRYICPP